MYGIWLRTLAIVALYLSCGLFEVFRITAKIDSDLYMWHIFTVDLVKYMPS